MEEITRPNPARPASPAADPRPRPHPLRTTLVLGIVLLPILCALTFAAAAYASTAAIRLPPVDSQTLGRIAASLISTPPSPVPPPSPTPLPAFQPSGGLATSIPFPNAVFASPTPAPTRTPTLSPTPTETSTPTLTATFTITPTFTSTPTFTPTYTATVTPSLVPSNTPTAPPTATPTPTRTPSNTSLPPTATSSPTFTATPPAPTATPDPNCTPSGNAAYESTLLGLINQERNDRGLPSYNSHSQLQAAARGHSTDMACNGFFSHTGSDGSNVGQRVTAQGYSWSWVGENIFATSDTSANAPQSAFDWWMNSAPHRANLLNTNYIDIGIGYVYLAGSPYGGYFTAVFARP